jgi:TonB family protein
MKRSTDKKMRAMNNFILYLLQSTIILAIQYSVYWLFLRKDTFFQVNRIFLLSSMLISLVVPLFELRIPSVTQAAPLVLFLDPVLITAEKVDKVASVNLTWFQVAGLVYITGVMIFTLRFIVQLIQLFLLIKRNNITHHEGYNLIFVDKGYSPFSFFNMIFIRKEYYIDGKLTPVIEHEKVHIRQYHTVDLILIELGTILQWFNPFAWFLGRSLKSLHEFMADEGVLQQGFSKSDYQSLILNEAMGLQVNGLSNNFNVSLLKKRIKMMTKTRSASWTSIKVGFALPALLAVIFLFTAGGNSILSAQDTQQKPNTSTDQKSETQENTSTEDAVFVVVEKMPEYPGGDEALINFLVSNIKYPEEARTKGIQGRVFVTFVVEKNGAVTNVKVIRGIGGGCDEEAIRVVSLMPKWTPGEQHGKTVRVQFNLPIMFSLNDKKAEDKAPENK